MFVIVIQYFITISLDKFHPIVKDLKNIVEIVGNRLQITYDKANFLTNH